MKRRSIPKRLAKLEEERARDLAHAEKDAFHAAAFQVLVAHHFGGLRLKEASPWPAWERAVGGLTPPELVAHCIKRTLSEEDRQPAKDVYARLWQKVRRTAARHSSEPETEEAIDEAIERMVEQLPEKWQIWIDESVEQSVQGEARVFEIEKELLERFGMHF
jgi:hypothetical protein